MLRLIDRARDFADRTAVRQDEDAYTYRDLLTRLELLIGLSNGAVGSEGEAIG